MEKIETINGYNISTDPVIKYLRKRFKIYDLYDEKSLNLIKDIFQDVEYFLLEKSMIRENLFVELNNDSEFSSEFDKILRESFKANKPTGFNTIGIESVDIEDELKKEDYWVYPDISKILNVPDSKITLNENTKEIEGFDILKELLSDFEFEAFLFKVIKPADYEYKYIHGLKNSGIDVFFQEAVMKIRLLQEKEKENKKRAQKASKIAKKIKKPVNKVEEWRKRREQRSKEN